MDVVLGQYRRFGPRMQETVQTYAPFLPWWLNSMRFVYWTLPIHHPLLTALLTKTEATLEDEWKRQHKGLPPGDLQSAIVLGPGKVLNLAHFTPFGAFTAQSAGVGNLSDIVLSQISGALSAAAGQTFFGKPIKGLTDGQRALLIANAFVTSFVRGASLYKTIGEGGHTAADTSTVFAPKGKPGSKKQSPASRILNPLRPTYTSGQNASQRAKKPSEFSLPATGKNSEFTLPGGPSVSGPVESALVMSLEQLAASMTRYSATLATLERADDEIAAFVEEYFDELDEKQSRDEVDREMAWYLAHRVGLADYDAVLAFIDDEFEAAIGRSRSPGLLALPAWPICGG